MEKKDNNIIECFHETTFLDENENLRTLKIPVVQELARQGLNHLPQRFKMMMPTHTHTHHHDDVVVHDILPTISLAKLKDGPDEAEESLRLAGAARGLGAFLIVDHGVPWEVVEGARQVVRGFFELSFQEKKDCVGSYGGYDNMGYGRNYIKCEDQAVEWIDRLTVRAIPPIGEDEGLHVWPLKPHNFREAMEKYVEEARGVMDFLLVALAESLSLENHHVFLNYFHPKHSEIKGSDPKRCGTWVHCFVLLPSTKNPKPIVTLEDDDEEGGYNKVVVDEYVKNYYKVSPTLDKIAINFAKGGGTVVRAEELRRLGGVARGLVVEGAREVVRGFFELSFEEKKECVGRNNGGEVDNMGYGRNFVKGCEDEGLDWIDRLTMRALPPLPLQQDDDDEGKLHAWPRKPNNFREAIERYVEEARKVMDLLLVSLAEALSLENHDVFLNYFHPTQSLQVLNKDQTWVTVSWPQDHLLVIIGDLLEIMSNGLLQSTWHRVVTQRDVERGSIALFYCPPPKTLIQPIVITSEDDHHEEEAYKKVVVEDYVGHYYKFVMVKAMTTQKPV
ncbi:protein SRG1-like [Senna tora]|uniref:Protein SRG1-like n=1 Tax=Senna tora TaxID=362788 RepID=A0A834X927_9FABA|nr:protein SRG1-like [Senna tora]